MLRSGSTDLQINNKTRSITLLTESGLNALILKSKKPYAIKIRIWVTIDKHYYAHQVSILHLFFLFYICFISFLYLFYIF
jgi:hypothetical protein